jgi:hypothetical protein
MVGERADDDASELSGRTGDEDAVSSHQAMIQ